MKKIFSIVMMRTVNYIMHNFVVENQLYENPLVSPHHEHWYSGPRQVNFVQFLFRTI